MKLIPTFRSNKTVRNCWYCVIFWCFFVVFWSIDTLARGHTLFRNEINYVKESNNYVK